MKKLTIADVQQFAKTCGFTFKRYGTGYLLITPYKEYKSRTLTEINKIIIHDNNRMNSSRF